MHRERLERSSNWYERYSPIITTFHQTISLFSCGNGITWRQQKEKQRKRNYSKLYFVATENNINIRDNIAYVQFILMVLEVFFIHFIFFLRSHSILESWLHRRKLLIWPRMRWSESEKCFYRLISSAQVLLDSMNIFFYLCLHASTCQSSTKNILNNWMQSASLFICENGWQ